MYIYIYTYTYIHIYIYTYIWSILPCFHLVHITPFLSGLDVTIFDSYCLHGKRATNCTDNNNYLHGRRATAAVPTRLAAPVTESATGWTPASVFSECSCVCVRVCMGVCESM